MKHNLYNVDDRKYHYFYKVTNNITGQYYYGIHSTNKLNDGYMGSGSSLRRAKKEYGKENFTKEIIKYFNNRDEASVYENEIVTQDVINDVKCYNLRTGGDYGVCIDTVLVFDTRTGEMIRCKRNDPLYLDGTYINFMKGRVNVFDIVENTNKIVSCDEYKKHKDIYLTITNNKICVKDKNGNIFMVSNTDPRYISGELTYIWKNRHHTEETKLKMSKSKKGTGMGNNNSQWNTCWITKSGMNMKIKISDLQKYTDEGWIKKRDLHKYSKPRKLTDIDPKTIYQDKVNGMTWKQLGEKYNCGKNTIYRYLKIYNHIK